MVTIQVQPSPHPNETGAARLLANNILQHFYRLNVNRSGKMYVNIHRIRVCLLIDII